MITMESELKHIKYVWVDAICVDQRPTKRKATIYQMSNIYNRATYILAVPDLHLAYLKGVSTKHLDIIKGANNFRSDIYHLIHGNAAKLAVLEETFLDFIDVPKDPPALRQLLLKCTDHFSHGFMKYRIHASKYCPSLALDHICETSQVSRNNCPHPIKNSSNPIRDLHQCNKEVCPLLLFCQDMDSIMDEEFQSSELEWKPLIVERSTAIRQSMDFLADLVKDWSSRVWVISEYNIAKTKNNLKFWFLQLSSTYDDKVCYRGTNGEVSFFTFDFNDTSFSDAILDTGYYSNGFKSYHTRMRTSNPIYIHFHYTMIRQVNKQTFLEMILRSKASKNEDRFYSILPLSEYQDKITEVPHWNIGSMVSVKLKLYEIMNINHKFALLFWSTPYNAVANGILPTFLTSTLPLEVDIGHLLHGVDIFTCNFDLENPSSIMLHHPQHVNNNNNNDDDGGDHDDHGSNRYFLRLKPKKYSVINRDHSMDIPNEMMTKSIPIFRRLGIHHASTKTLDIISIPAFIINRKYYPYSDYEKYFLFLVGCFVKNKWMILSHHYYEEHNTFHLKNNDVRETNKSVPFLDIY
ncbi:unnamed protein product [Absidia cylindrospora]